jgi:hypothetical protein
MRRSSKAHIDMQSFGAVFSHCKADTAVRADSISFPVKVVRRWAGQGGHQLVGRTCQTHDEANTQARYQD